MPSTVLLSASPAATGDLRDALAAAGCAVRDHALGSAPTVSFSGVDAAVLDAGDQVTAAAAQTRRWRAELGDEHLPVVWVLDANDPAAVARGLDAGADAVLVRPVDGAVLAAQVRSAARSRAAAGRVASRAAEARLVGDQLTRTFAQIDRELDLTRRVRLALLQRTLPDSPTATFAVCHRPRSRNGGDFYAVHALDRGRTLFLVGDVIGHTTAGGLLGAFVAEAVRDAARERPTAPAGALVAEANLALLRLGLEDAPLVSLVAGVLDESGALSIARAGLPAPLHLPANGPPAAWNIPGPFLGIAETTYPSHVARLRPGDALLVATDGTRPDGDPGPDDGSRLPEIAARHAGRTGQQFVDGVATDLLAQVRHEDDVTLLALFVPIKLNEPNALDVQATA
ncbi:stage ii sporulation protein e : Response regulator receiver domain/protein phosphatase 2C domain-containing protein OS=Celeribacter baekdonensis B30 GN=B30_02280 PE=4 SV=1: SpoIIE [Gemmataceae bacterium]|nr:stage ii sporulation protein e : Response regulator receiver domain/protein phosphatase 2C domain-containing protein OS=Celeribacter baekdonensis B30 GN=B30_02280 PE=4 SV=1: SpoIIE [Gemmataceae bacterium]VTU01993.1 stage ii sporulation protein e : Response regulator receiver domain/protein phosphatase 2C domain-containing protein OS=Celeribacter baekdonensis B30 GN=B30_02280 PE=4 SV=1: SpoIIE [Gemmataceae bacterium]